MSIRMQICLLAAVFCAFAPGARAQVTTESENDAAPRVLTLADCLEIAGAENIGLKRARLGIEASLLDRIRAESAFDPGFELDLSGQRRETAQTSGTSGWSSQVDLAMRYRLPTWSGGAWVFSLDQSRSSGSSTIGESAGGNTSYSSNVGLAHSLPLLEGQGERINRLGVERADLAVSRSEAAVNEAVRSLRLGIIQAYVAAVLAARQIEVAQLSLGTAENLVAEVQARIDVGQLAPYELLAAEAGLAERKEALLNAEAGLATALDTLKELIGLPLAEEIAIDPETLRAIYLEVDPDDLFMLAQRNRADLREIDLRTQQARLDLFLATDRRQSSLNWITTLGLSGRGEDYGRSLENLDNFSWYTGLEYSLPLGGNRAAIADVASAKLALEGVELERVGFLRVLQRDLRAAVEELHNAELRTDVTAQGLQVQEVKMENEVARLRLGLITSKDLLEFDLDLANARLAYDAALADALRAVARLEYLVNATLLGDAYVADNLLERPEATR